MDVEIISKECVKPSSATPDSLRNYKLCSLDQAAYASYIPIVFFYSNPDPITFTQVHGRIEVLKKSLAQTLSRFFPLAGTIKDEVWVYCDDRGASFTTAKVINSSYSSLTDFLLVNPNLKLISDKFLPCGFLSTTEHPYITNIQATVFDCGGIALGVCISHKIVDAAALCFFLKSWVGTNATAWMKNSSKLGKVLDDQVYPDFSEATYLFPSRDLRVQEASMATFCLQIKEVPSATRRFVFDGSSIAALKEKAKIKDQRLPSKVEVVVSFIWKYAMAATICKGKSSNNLLGLPVNLRKRGLPVSAQQSLGNLVWFALAKVTPEETNQLGFSDLVEKVKKSITKIDGGFVGMLVGDQGFSTILEYLKENNEFCSKGANYFSVSSWCKFGFYEMDFGWGKPVWISHRDASGPFCFNSAVLMDSNCGEGIEAWVTLDEQRMSVLENNKEFLTYASLNPSPLRTTCTRDD